MRRNSRYAKQRKQCKKLGATMLLDLGIFRTWASPPTRYNKRSRLCTSRLPAFRRPPAVTSNGSRPRCPVSQNEWQAISARAEKSGASHQLSAARSQFTLGEIAARQGNHTVAVSHFGGAVKFAADTITFDVALFEQNITSALAGQTTGHAFSIAYGGQLYQGGESSGVARTPQIPQRRPSHQVKRCTLPA